MDYTYKVFYSEVRGTSVYTRVQIDIEGESEPLVIGFDIPGSGDSQAAIDSAVQARVAELVMERAGARSMTTEILDQTGTQDISAVATTLQEQINIVTEPLGLTATVELLNPPALTDIEQMAVLEQQITEIEDNIAALSEQVG